MDFVRIGVLQAWQVTLLIAVVWLLVRFWGSNRPHLSHLLWVMVLVKCLTPPLWSSPVSGFSWLQTSLHTPATEVEADLLLQPIPPASGLASLDDFDGVVVDAQPVPDGVFPASPEESATGVVTPWGVLGTLWAIGFGLVFSATAYRRISCRRRLQRASSCAAPELEQLVTELASRLGLRRQVRLQVTTSQVGPAVIGLFRPIILLPQAVVSRRRPSELEPILAHELIHVRRGDLWTGALQVAAQAVWWFHPLVHLANRLSSREAERCCDEEVVGELGCDPKEYAHSLLAILELKKTLQPVPTFPGMRPVEVTSQRLERVMRLRHGCHKRAPRWCWITVLLFATAVLPGAAFTVADDAPPNASSAVPAGDAAQPGSKVWDRVILEDGTEFTFEITADPRVPPKPAVDEVPRVKAWYAVARLLPALQRQLRSDRQQALTFLAHQLAAEARIAVGEQETPFTVEGSRIQFEATAKQHERVKAALGRMREYGVAVFHIRMQFVAVPEAVVNETIPSWELTPVDVPAGEKFASSAPFDRPLDRPLPGTSDQPSAKAEITTATNLPAIHKVLDADGAERLTRALKEEAKSRTLSEVQLRVFNGQSAAIADLSQRPFVVGLKKVSTDKSAVVPQIRVIDCGRLARIRPLLRQDDKVWIDFDIKQSEISEVDTRTINAAGLEELTVQVPRVHTARVESAVEMKLGQTALIGGLPAEIVKDTDHQLLILMTVHRVNTETESEVVSVPKSATPEKPLNQVEATLAAFDAQLSIEPDDSRLPTGGYSDPSAAAVANHIAAKLRQEVEPRFSQVPLAEAVRWISERIETNIYISSEILEQHKETRVVLDLSQPVSAASALRLILEPRRLYCEVTGEILVVRRKSQPPHYAVTYNVADLLTVDLEPIRPESFVASPDDSPQMQSLALLVAAIRESVAPESWRDRGGSGAMHPFPAQLSVVVNQSQTVHSALKEYLAKQRAELGLPVAAKPVPTRRAPRQAGRITVRTYNVADLVTPIPGFTRESTSRQTAQADFAPLTELIRSTVEPDSWDRLGGAGAIEPYEANLSLVISQTVGAHDEIADLLEQLRRLQEVQVTLEARFVRVPAEFWTRMQAGPAPDGGHPADLKSVQARPGEPRELSPTQATKILRTAINSPDADVVMAPKVTLFNGQEATVQCGDFAAELRCQAVVADDRRSIRLACAVDEIGKTDLGGSQTIADGGAVVMQLPAGLQSKLLEPAKESHFQGFVNSVSKWFGAEPKSSEEPKVLLFVTPRILIPEEEEAVIGEQETRVD